MHVRFTPEKHILAASLSALFVSAGALAQVQPPAAVADAATVVVTGTRVANRTALDTTSPVDIISAESLKISGVTEIPCSLNVGALNAGGAF